MLEALRGDYARMSAMIFGEIPTFEDVMASVERLEAILNEAAK